MTPEQKAAVERLRKLQGSPVTDWRRPSQSVMDMMTVCELCLAEHPPDAPSAADELREARQIISELSETASTAKYKRAREFLKRTEDA